MGSRRLPGKVLRKIGAEPLLGCILTRLRSLRVAAKTVVATTSLSADDAIEKYANDRAAICFRGSENDVLGRYLECAKMHYFSQIVRLTADNPFVDVWELDRLIELHILQGNDYTESLTVLPIGVGAEIFSLSALERSDREGQAAHHREHVNEYVLEHPEFFRSATLSVPGEKMKPEVRLTVDTEEDYLRARYIAEHASGDPVDTEEAILLCSRFA